MRAVVLAAALVLGPLSGAAIAERPAVPGPIRADAVPLPRSPHLAAALAVAAPAALIVLSSQSTDFLVSFSVPVLGLGAGHLYAGDPIRGALVTAGSTAAGVGAFALLHRSGGNGGGGAYLVGMLAVGLSVGLAASDAYWTVERQNVEAAGEPESRPAGEP